VQILRRHQRIEVEQARKLLQLGYAFRFQRLQEHARIQAAQATRQGSAALRQVERRRDRASRVDKFGLVLRLAQPAQQHIAAQRHAAGVELAGCVRVQAADDPVQFTGVAGMVEARRQVRFAGAAAEMRHGARPAAAPDFRHQGARVMAVGGAFQSMEQHHEGLAWLAVDEIDIDEIGVRGRPPFTAETDVGLGYAGSRIDGLQMAARQPERSDVVHGAAGTGPAGLIPLFLSAVFERADRREQVPALQTHDATQCANPSVS
jgi:hypothetical protein